jgi:F0F1-type ATP synthase membrane subunit c/vacuolar-type H+-ATPase subunit K
MIIAMQDDPLFFFRIVSGIGLAVSIGIGVFVAKNANRMFGTDPSVPSENASARSQTQLLVFAVLAHALLFFSVGVLFL